MRLIAPVLVLFAVVTAGCSSGGSVSVDDLKQSSAPYYYVGSSFDGLDVSHVERYQRGVANIIYGTCEAGDDEGCPPPLALQHRLCNGRVTVVIFVGQGARGGSAARAADALRPLSQGAKGRRPEIAFDRSPAC